MAYRIHWENRDTGKQGHGAAVYETRQQALEEALRLNKDFPENEHWYEREDESPAWTIENSLEREG